MDMRRWGAAAGLVTLVLVTATFDVVEAGAATAEGTFERTLRVTGPVDLSVRTGSGRIEIRPSADDAVHVTARVRVSDSLMGDSAQHRLAEIQAHPPIEQAANSIRLGFTNGDALYRNVGISYEIAVPSHARLQARSGSGSIGIAIAADEIDARTGSGGISAVGASGPFEAHTGSGDVRVGRVGGALTVSTGSGDIEAAQTVSAPVDMKTGSGRVSLELPRGSGFSLNVHTGSGGINTTHPVTTTGTQSKHNLQGTVRGGGPAVVVRTGSGTVTIR